MVVNVFLFDDFEVMDAFGPVEIFGRVPESIIDQIVFGCFVHILHIVHPLYFLLDVLAEQSGRFYKKYHDQNCKADSICNL